MRPPQPYRSLPLVLATTAALTTGCAPMEQPESAPGAQPGVQPGVQPLPPGEIRWTVTTRPTMDLWYHGLATLDFRGGAGALPIHPADYPARMRAAKEAAGVYPTVLDRRAEEFRALFEAGPRYSALHFLPLHFPDGEALFATLRAWIQVGGDPRRVADQNLAGAVNFIAQQFPTEAERRALAGWLEVLTEEGRVFYTAHRERQTPQLATLVAGAQSEWDALAPRIRPILDYLHLNQGEIVVSPPIGPEGRTLDVGRQFNRVAVLMPEANRPGDIVWVALHELMYPFVNSVLEDQLSPAQRRDADQSLLARRAAVRAGALALAQVAPEALQPYREAHLRLTGATVPASPAERERALATAYPLPEPIPAALQSGIETMLRRF